MDAPPCLNLKLIHSFIHPTLFTTSTQVHVEKERPAEDTDSNNEMGMKFSPDVVVGAFVSTQLLQNRNAYL